MALWTDKKKKIIPHYIKNDPKIFLTSQEIDKIAMYRNGNIVLIVNDDVWQLCISGSGITSAQCEAPDGFTLSQPEVLLESSELFE